MTERQEQMIYDEGRRRGFEEGKEYILKTMIVIPNNVEQGSETFIGEDIVVCHHDDYMNMMLDAAQWNEYGEGKADRPKGEWIRTGRTNIYGGIEVQCSNCGDKVMVQHIEDEWYCRHCGADMGLKGADDE